jgi:hypothetical protein
MIYNQKDKQNNGQKKKDKETNKEQKTKNTTLNTPITHIHGLSLFRLGTSTSITRGGVKLVLWGKTSNLKYGT